MSKKDLLPNALTGTEPVAGKIAVTQHLPRRATPRLEVRRGECQRHGLTIPKGKIAISVNLSDPARVAGFVNPGDKVAIFLTGTRRRGRATPGCCCPACR